MSRTALCADHSHQYFTVTHPFHPLHGQQFEFVDCRSCWGQRRVYYYGESRQLVYIPADWTDLAEPDPFVIASQGRAIARAEDLLRLAELIRDLNSKTVKETRPSP